MTRKAPACIAGGWFDIFLQDTLDAYAALRAEGLTARLVIGPWTHGAQRDPVGEVEQSALLAQARHSAQHTSKGMQS